MITVNSYIDFLTKAVGKDEVVLLLYKSDSDQSLCAYKNLYMASTFQENTHIFTADVSKVEDIHGIYDMESIPSLLIFSNGKYKNTITGCRDSLYYAALMKASDKQPLN